MEDKGSENYGQGWKVSPRQMSDKAEQFSQSKAAGQTAERQAENSNAAVGSTQSTDQHDRHDKLKIKAGVLNLNQTVAFRNPEPGQDGFNPKTISTPRSAPHSKEQWGRNLQAKPFVALIITALLVILLVHAKGGTSPLEQPQGTVTSRIHGWSEEKAGKHESPLCTNGEVKTVEKKREKTRCYQISLQASKLILCFSLASYTTIISKTMTSQEPQVVQNQQPARSPTSSSTSSSQMDTKSSTPKSTRSGLGYSNGQPLHSGLGVVSSTLRPATSKDGIPNTVPSIWNFESGSPKAPEERSSDSCWITEPPSPSAPKHTPFQPADHLPASYRARRSATSQPSDGTQAMRHSPRET